MDSKLEGGCFCGKIRYEILAKPITIVHCHCNNCKKSVGAPFITWAVVSVDDLKFTDENPTIFIADNNTERGFCRQCGSSITYQKTGKDTIDITVGTLDNPNRVKPSKHIWDKRRIQWIKMNDDLPHFSEWSSSNKPIEQG